jgi:ketosteroid isomerase-like protein
VYEEFHVEIERLIALGDRAVVLVRGRARARGSGVEFDFRQGYIWTVKDGKAVRFEWFNEPRQALAAAGLDPAQGEGDATRSG